MNAACTHPHQTHRIGSPARILSFVWSGELGAQARGAEKGKKNTGTLEIRSLQKKMSAVSVEKSGQTRTRARRQNNEREFQSLEEAKEPHLTLPYLTSPIGDSCKLFRSPTSGFWSAREGRKISVVRAGHAYYRSLSIE